MNAILLSAGRYVRLAMGRGQIANDHQRRYVRILQGMVAGLAGKGVGILVSFISVPLTVRYLGGERYGIWVTISTALAWITLADFGLSNTLTTTISETYAQDRRDLAQSYVASAFWLMAAVALLFGSIFFSLWHRVPWNWVFNVQAAQAQTEVAPAVAVDFLIFAINLPFSSIGRIYAGYQQVAAANAWTAAGSLLGLVALVGVTWLKGGLVPLVIAVSGSALAVNAASAAWVFWRSKPWLIPRFTSITRQSIRKLSEMGGMFFAIQLAALALFQTDNLIIAHYLGAKAVTPYSVAWRLFTYTTIFQMLAVPSYWPAYAEAFARGDLPWIRRSFRMNFAFSVATTLALALPLVLFGKWFILKWAGGEAVPTLGLLFWMGVWSIINAAMASQACILASSGRLKGQMMYSLAAAGVNLVLSITLVQRIGLNGVILGTIITYLICVVGPTWIEVKAALRGPGSSSVQIV
jgi:O-antigen/teichoic acid export membrane protein